MHRNQAAAIHPPRLHIRVAPTLDAFRSVWPTMRAQGTARCYPFQCADVLDIWCGTIGRARAVEPVFVAMYAGGDEPALLLPLGIENTHGHRVLSFLDAGTSDYNAPVIFAAAARLKPQDIETLWKQLRDELPRFDLAIFDKMPEQIGDLQNPLVALATRPHPDSAHAKSLSGTSEAFVSSLPNARDSQRRRRKLEKMGEVRFAVADTVEQRRDFFEAMVRMKRRRFAETAAHDVFADQAYLDYYAEATRLLGPSGAVRLSALLLDDRILAADWGYVSADRYYDLMPSYESGNWRSYAPGRLLTEWLTSRCLEEGLGVFDYGIGDEAYKFDYCDTHLRLWDAYLPLTARGALYGKMLQLRSSARKMLEGTKIGTALKAARNRLRGSEALPASSVSRPYLPAWIALIGSVTLAVDA
jgi:CelD/BcsL family acetyltransferase involved in cellulose biosynthesis